MYDLRRNDYDVSNSVQVSSTASVTAAVRELFAAGWPGESFDRVATAFEEFDSLFARPHARLSRRRHRLSRPPAFARHDAGDGAPVGRLRGAASRRTCASASERAVMALVTSLFHDAGYIREFDDLQHRNGAEFTLYHVTRSARFLARFLPTIGMEAWVPISTRIVHFTGYEIKLSQIQLADGRDRKLGHLLGTADLIAQMADRCYLEKCRDRLYPEFVLGGIAAAPGSDGDTAGALQLRPGFAAPDAALRARDARAAARRRVRARLPVRRSRCSPARTPTSTPSNAISSICSAYCAPSAGACCGEIRPCSPPKPTSSARCADLMVNRLKALWA